MQAAADAHYNLVKEFVVEKMLPKCANDELRLLFMRKMQQKWAELYADDPYLRNQRWI